MCEYGGGQGGDCVELCAPLREGICEDLASGTRSLGGPRDETCGELAPAISL